MLFGPVEPGSRHCGDEALDELASLVDSAGGVVVGRLVQSVHRPTPATYLGSGKIEELGQLMRDTGADLAVFDLELSPAQGRNIEEAIAARVVDRTELILDIFARRARSRQAQLQVGLAQHIYMLPRLKRLWTHLDRQHAAIGARGPGETQIESDRRMVRKRIQDYTRKLKELTAQQERLIENRGEFKVCLVGYTNAGKSTLMKALTGTDAFIADQLFATLDTTTRRLKFKGSGPSALVSDTVGFVNHLPHQLVESFHATLSEVREADLLLHVADAAHPHLMEQVETVEQVLKDIGCHDLPTLLVANKMDRPGAEVGIHDLRTRHPELIEVSALTGRNVDLLLQAIAREMSEDWLRFDLLIPFREGELLAKIRTLGRVRDERPDEQGMLVTIEVSRETAQKLRLERWVPPAR